jgi:uncharacterized protein (DUF433 family)
MVTKKFDRRYGQPVFVGLAGEGALGNLLADHYNKGKLSRADVKEILDYRKSLNKKKKK